MPEMSNRVPAHEHHPRPVVISREGAAIRVERTELTGALLRRLTTNVRSLPAPRTRVPPRPLA
jgi:hypothetical protein